MNAIVSIFSAFGLSTAAGLNAYLPLLTVGPVLLLFRPGPVMAIVLLLRRCSGGNQQGNRGDRTK